MKINSIVEIDVSSVNGFIENILRYSSHRGDYIRLYRGHQKYNWELKPRIARVHTADKLKEKKILDEFYNLSIPYLSDWRSYSDWDKIAIAQHFRLRTRLLDWTTNPLIALWFAFQKPNDDSVKRCVWGVLADESNLSNMNNDLFSQNPISFFKPNQLNSRIISQSGWFSVHQHDESNNSYFEINAEYCGHENLAKFIFPDNERNQILQFLDSLGINQHSVFKDLDSLSEYLEWKYFSDLSTRRVSV